VTIDFDSFFTTAGLRGVAGALFPPTDEEEDLRSNAAPPASKPITPLIVGLDGGVEGFKETTCASSSDK